MGETIKFYKIINESIFTEDFVEFSKNNEIEFKRNKWQSEEQGIAVLYGPNGTGKTSFAKVLDGDGEFEVEYKKNFFSDKANVFHIIKDQISRNVIQGETEDFLLGENIRREYSLKSFIDKEFKKIFGSDLYNKLKNEMNITKKTSNLLGLINDQDLKKYIVDIINTKSYGKNIDRNEFIKSIRNMNLEKIESEDEKYDDKLNFIKKNYIDKKSVLSKLIEVSKDEIIQNNEIKQIEENRVAISILEQFDYKTNCIVCDNAEFDRNELLRKKIENKERIFKALDKKTKDILEEIINTIDREHTDPFNIKDTIIEAIKDGNKQIIEELLEIINEYFSFYEVEIKNAFYECLNKELLDSFNEYQDLIKEQPVISDEEVLFIQNIVSENIGRKIVLCRDEENDNNFRIMLDNKPLLGANRDSLHLSNGEQNFISLAFELLKARNSDCEIVVVDDPISSFDSIYKNKIAFCMVKFLDNKKQLVLSHNTELIKLLEAQMQGCFNLYLFNNMEGQENGFIKVNKKEQKLLLDLSKLLAFFRNHVQNEIENEQLFLISLIPFLRGYANIVGNSEEYSNLSKLMHGYEKEEKNITKIYNNLLGKEHKIENEYIISAKDICELDLTDISIFKSDSEYKLLERTLIHTLNYLFLRLKVEKELIELYIPKMPEGKNMLLTNIINEAFKDEVDILDKPFFTSRKTLLNEFNHFEGNMNIYQPAIDITDVDLIKEKTSILEYLVKLHERAKKLEEEKEKEKVGIC